MKKLFNLLLLSVFCLEGCYTSGQVPQNDGYNDNYNNNYNNNGGEVSYQTFYDQLQPYGNWIDYPGYGYVWQPNAGADFRPYQTSGHWVSTVDGWAWASDYDWGWAPFHYGRWLFEPAIGWVWVPGYEWAPAWVTWGQYDNYYAWAPLAPGISIGIGSTWRAPYNYWSFIPHNYIQYSNPSRYIVRNNFNTNVVNNITIINNYNSYNKREYYHRGPDYREVERYTHTQINPLAVASIQRPGAARVNQRQFEVYRPAVLHNTIAGRPAPAPLRVRTINDVRGGVDVRRPDNDNSRVNTFNQGANQNNTSGSVVRPDRTGTINNNGNDRRDNQNSTIPGGERVINQDRINQNPRIERLPGNNTEINAGNTPAPAQQPNQDNHGTTPVIRPPQIPQPDVPNTAVRPVTPQQPLPQNNNTPYNNQRQNRQQQAPANNQNPQYNQNQRVYQRTQNTPQPNNNVYRGQQQRSPASPGAMQSRPSVQPRMQPMPRPQSAPVQRPASAPRAHERR